MKFILISLLLFPSLILSGASVFTVKNRQILLNGEPFIIHPVEVALLLSGMKMDAETVMAGLLHDTVEDTDMKSNVSRDACHK